MNENNLVICDGVKPVALAGVMGGLNSEIRDTTEAVMDRLRQTAKEQRIKTVDEAKLALRGILADMLNVGDPALKLDTKPSVILVIGVNGVGKTTTIGKLAHQLHDQGKKVLLCAGDTFRAAAADQLEIWSERAHCDIIRQHEGADPASVVFDAIAAARARGSDVIIGPNEALFSRRVFVRDLNWIAFDAPPEGLRAQAKLRYTPKTAACTVHLTQEGAELLFDEPQRAVTPGQAAVLYDGDVVLGGGTITGSAAALRCSIPSKSSVRPVIPCPPCGRR